MHSFWSNICGFVIVTVVIALPSPEIECLLQFPRLLFAHVLPTASPILLVATYDITQTRKTDLYKREMTSWPPDRLLSYQEE
jgi:hypothetical protein